MELHYGMPPNSSAPTTRSFCLGVRADREIARAAMQPYGEALQYASEELRADHEVVLAAVQRHRPALRYASEQLRADNGIVLAAVRQYGEALHYAPEELRTDHEVVPAVQCHAHGTALRHASEQLRADHEIVLPRRCSAPTARSFGRPCSRSAGGTFGGVLGRRGFAAPKVTPLSSEGGRDLLQLAQGHALHSGAEVRGQHRHHGLGRLGREERAVDYLNTQVSAVGTRTTAG
jgi:hypothetical protein